MFAPSFDFFFVLHRTWFVTRLLELPDFNINVLLTEADHHGGVYPVGLVRGRIALDAVIGPEVAFVDLRIVFASKRLEYLRESRRTVPVPGVEHRTSGNDSKSCLRYN